MIGSNIMNASSPMITHKAHSGDSPIIGQHVRDQCDRLWSHIVGRDRVIPSAYMEACIWRRAAQPLPQFVDLDNAEAAAVREKMLPEQDKTAADAHMSPDLIKLVMADVSA